MSATADSMCYGFVTITGMVLDDNGLMSPKVDTVRYDQFVRRLFKVMPSNLMKAHAAMGIMEEAGEAAGEIKKEIIYGKPVDRDKLVKELGDLRFYEQAVRQLYGISEQEVLQTNANKLSQRYKDLTYTDEQAVRREDKNGNPGTAA